MKWRTISILSVVVFATSCAILPRGHSGPGVRLFIANESWDHVGVVISQDGEQQALGRIWKDQFPVFDLDPIPAGQVSRIVVTVASENGESFRTDTILARAGTSIDLRLQTPLRDSRLTQSHRAALPSPHASGSPD